MPPPARIRRAAGVRGRVPPPPTLDEEPTLQLAIAREGVGLELSAPVDLGSATLTVARTRLVGLRFPLDVSGGVERFRHRRTALERAVIDVDAARAERWLASHAHDLFARGAADVRLATIDHADDPDGLRVRRGDLRIDLVPLASESESESQRRAADVRLRETEDETGLLAFDVAFEMQGGGVVGHAHRARSVGVQGSQTALIGRFLQRIARALGGKARGLRIEIDDPARLALVQAFVPRGARVPSREQVVVSAWAPVPDGWMATLERDRPAKAPRPIAVALAELDRAVGEADAAMVDGDAQRARALYLHALERAPRHKAILLRLAEVDASIDDHAEAALGWLREAHRTRGATSKDQDDNELGRTLLFASLQARLGALGRARAAWQRAGDAASEDGEGRLAARAWALAAATCADDDPQLFPLLDRALAADPSETNARWRRARLRIAAKDDEQAMEDVQHLEMLARGREVRRRTLLRAATIWAEAGRNDRAISAYERALRHTPDDRDAIAGLGEALIAANEVGRGVALLSRAATLEGDEDGAASILLALAEALATRVGDVPAAIARLRDLPRDSPRSALACLLESSYRARLGDRVGAVQAAARAIDLCERRNVPPLDGSRVCALLCEIARSKRVDDPAFATRLALAAVTVAPHDAQARTLALEIGDANASPFTSMPPTAFESTSPPPRGDAAPPKREPEPTRSEVDTDADDERRAETLLARVKADPDDDAAVDALIDLLSKLGRDFELFALLSARFDEAPAERRRTMKPRQRAVLERLAAAAEANGRSTEAALYREAAQALAD